MKSNKNFRNYQTVVTNSELILDCWDANRGMRNAHMPIVAVLIVLLLRRSLRFNYFIGLPLFLVLYRSWRYPFASRVYQSGFIASVVFLRGLVYVVVYLSVALELTETKLEFIAPVVFLPYGMPQRTISIANIENLMHI